MKSPRPATAPAAGVTFTVVCLLVVAATSPASALAVAVVLNGAFSFSRVGARFMQRMPDSHVTGATAVVLFTSVVSAAAIAMSTWWPSLNAGLTAAWPMLSACGLLLAPGPQTRGNPAIATATLILLLCSVLLALAASIAARANLFDLNLLVAPWLPGGSIMRERALPGVMVPAACIVIGLVMSLRNRLTRGDRP